VAPLSAKHEVIVIGGFIGSTDDGRTTTIGRGGSDLTASILGAALNAEEIQVWKDVDGLLTWDPRLLSGAHNVSKLSYQEASELAHAGATILHPETVEPARRLRIPITIRNTFQSEALGTRITADTDAGEMPVKSIAVNKGLALLEVNVTNPADNCDSIIAFCKRHRSAVTLLHSSEKTAYIAIHENASLPDEQLPDSPSMTARARKQQAVFTVVGRLSAEISARIRSALQEVPFHLLPSDTPDLTLRFAVPEHRVEQCLKLLNREFFSALEIQPLPERASRESESRQPATGPARPQRFVLSPALVQRN
jgi:aspartate kinase